MKFTKKELLKMLCEIENPHEGIVSTKIIAYNTLDTYYNDGFHAVSYKGKNFYTECPDGIKTIIGRLYYNNNTAQAICNRLNMLTPLQVCVRHGQLYSNYLDDYLANEVFNMEWERRKRLLIEVKYGKKSA